MRLSVREQNVDALTRELARLTGVDRLWQIDVKFVQLEEGGEEVRMDSEYRRATICFDLDSFEEKEDVEYAIHAIMHLIVEDMWHYAYEMTRDKRVRKWLRRLGENLVTDLERMPLWKLDALQRHLEQVKAPAAVAEARPTHLQR